MPADRGKKRSEIEAHVHRLLLVDLFFAHGGLDKYSPKKAAADINAVLGEAAAARARLMGVDEATAKEMVDHSQITVFTVYNDLKDLERELREYAVAGRAHQFDAQIEAYQERIEKEVMEPLERLTKYEEGILADIERSRARSWRRVSGTLETTKDGKTKGKGPKKMLTHTADDAALPQLWNMLLKVTDKRVKLVGLEVELRTRLLMLTMGKQQYKKVQARAAGYVESLGEPGQEISPHRVAMEGYAELLDNLQMGDDGLIAAMPAEFARAHQARLRDYTVRIQALRGLADAASKGTLPTHLGNENAIIEVSVRRSPKQIGGGDE